VHIEICTNHWLRVMQFAGPGGQIEGCAAQVAGRHRRTLHLAMLCSDDSAAGARLPDMNHEVSA